MSENQNKKKRGPSPKPQEQQRKNRISIFLTDAEYSLIKEKAGAYELPIYVRTCALDGTLAPKPSTIPQLNIEAWKKLGRCTNNLNQLSRHMNQLAQHELVIDLDDLRQTLSAFRTALIDGGDA